MEILYRYKNPNYSVSTLKMVYDNDNMFTIAPSPYNDKIGIRGFITGIVYFVLKVNVEPIEEEPLPKELFEL